MKLSAAGRKRRRAAGRVAGRKGTSLSDAAGADHRRFCRVEGFVVRFRVLPREVRAETGKNSRQRSALDGAYRSTGRFRKAEGGLFAAPVPRFDNVAALVVEVLALVAEEHSRDAAKYRRLLCRRSLCRG
jgi:hypothetical protein